MCEAGRILHHLRNNIDDSRNCIMFVGYQAEGTLGRKIVERQPEVNILGEPHRRRAEVATLNAFSGHADKNDLFHYARTVKEASKNLKKVFLVHGEQDGLTELSGRLKDELKLDVAIPERGERHLLQELQD
jgi:metallo-beta-lactamase family protein